MTIEIPHYSHSPQTWFLAIATKNFFVSVSVFVVAETTEISSAPLIALNFQSQQTQKQQTSDRQGVVPSVRLGGEREGETEVKPKLVICFNLDLVLEVVWPKRNTNTRARTEAPRQQDESERVKKQRTGSAMGPRKQRKQGT